METLLSNSIMSKNTFCQYTSPRKFVVLVYYLNLALSILFSHTQSALVGYLNCVIIFLTLIAATKYEMFLLMLGLQFLGAVIPITIGESELNFIIFAYLIIFIKYYFVYGKPFNIDIISIIFLLIIELVNAVGYDVPPYSYIILWMFSFWYMILLLGDDTKYDIHDIVRFFCMAVWTICLINIIEEYTSLGQTLNPNAYGNWLGISQASKLFSFSGRDVIHRFGIAYKTLAGTNGLTMNLSLGICLCVIGISAKQKKHKIFYTITLFSFLYFGFLTISRSFYIEIFVFMFLYVIASVKDFRKLIKYLLLMLFVCVLFTLFFVDDLALLFDNVQTRFYDGDDNRLSFIKNSCVLLFNFNRILFFGAGSTYSTLYRFTAHNMILDSLLSLGVFGCLVYYVTMFKYYNNIKKRGLKFQLLNYIPLVMLILFRMISGCVRDVDFYYLLMIAILFTQYNYDGGDKGCLTSH